MIAGCAPPQLAQRRAALTAVAISARPDQLRPLLREARIGGSLVRPDAVLVHPSLLGHEVVLLDAVQLLPARLARLLVCLAGRAQNHRYGLAPRVAVLVEQADRVTPVLLASAPLVTTIVRPEELGARAPELSRLAAEEPRLPAPPLGLPRRFLDVLAALDGAETLDEAATTSGLSRTTIHRVLAQVRAALGLPAGRAAHFRAPELLGEIVGALSLVEALAEGTGAVQADGPDLQAEALEASAGALQLGGPDVPGEGPIEPTGVPDLPSESQSAIVSDGVATRVSEKSVDNSVKWMGRPAQLRLPFLD